MIWVIVIFVVLTAVLLEYYSVSLAPKRMQISFDTDLTLAEPGEEVCLSFVIRNQSRLPQLYVSVQPPKPSSSPKAPPLAEQFMVLLRQNNLHTW